MKSERGIQMEKIIIPEVFGATFVEKLEEIPTNNGNKANTWTTEQTHYDHDDD